MAKFSDEDGWILAKDKNRKGMIPKNYVRKQWGQYGDALNK
jgi:hypothetical protein